MTNIFNCCVPLNINVMFEAIDLRCHDHLNLNCNPSYIYITNNLNLNYNYVYQLFWFIKIEYGIRVVVYIIYMWQGCQDIDVYCLSSQKRVFF